MGDNPIFLAPSQAVLHGRANLATDHEQGVIVFRLSHHGLRLVCSTFALSLLFRTAAATELTVYENCILAELKEAEAGTAAGELRIRCIEQFAEHTMNPTTELEPSLAPRHSLMYQRLRRERAAERLPSILTPHNRNYVLPVSYADEPNIAPYKIAFGDAANPDFDRWEVKFQLSLKFRLAEGVFTEGDGVFASYTAQSFWQAYNKPVSSPFRETNYEPELFWISRLPWTPFNIDGALISFGFSHQSNGGSGALSRSWNRLYANLAWEQGNYVFSVKPWWRIPESEKTDPFDSSGDDNPELEHYMGHFEFSTAYRYGHHELSLLLRNNLDADNKGAVQIEWAFPVWGRVRGFAQYFNGYGESLIDYNVPISRFGVGILISDLL